MGSIYQKAPRYAICYKLRAYFIPLRSKHFPTQFAFSQWQKNQNLGQEAFIQLHSFDIQAKNLQKHVCFIYNYIVLYEMQSNDKGWAELLCNWHLVSPSVLASRPYITLDQILAEVRQLRGWCHEASSLTGGRVCLL